MGVFLEDKLLRSKRNHHRRKANQDGFTMSRPETLLLILWAALLALGSVNAQTYSNRGIISTFLPGRSQDCAADAYEAVQRTCFQSTGSYDSLDSTVCACNQVRKAASDVLSANFFACFNACGNGNTPCEIECGRTRDSQVAERDFSYCSCIEGAQCAQTGLNRIRCELFRSASGICDTTATLDKYANNIFSNPDGDDNSDDPSISAGLCSPEVIAAVAYTGTVAAVATAGISEAAAATF